MRITVKRIALMLIVLVMSTSLSSCLIFFVAGKIAGKQAKKHITVEKGSVPPDFGKDGTILVGIMTGKKSYDKYLKKNFEKKYLGKYVLGTERDLDNKYDDKTTYRYVFNFDMEYHQTADGGGNSVRRFYVLDRKDGKKYTAKMTSGFFSAVMKVYLEKLDQQRVKNK